MPTLLNSFQCWSLFYDWHSSDCPRSSELSLPPLDHSLLGYAGDHFWHLTPLTGPQSFPARPLWSEVIRPPTKKYFPHRRYLPHWSLFLPFPNRLVCANGLLEGIEEGKWGENSRNLLPVIVTEKPLLSPIEYLKIFLPEKNSGHKRYADPPESEGLCEAAHEM